MSTYSPLKIELIGTGEQDGTWGITTNTNLGTTLEEMITGTADVTFASGTQTLTLTNTNAQQVGRNLRLNLIGTSGGPQDLVLPAGVEKLYLINNATADIITCKNAGGTTVAVASSTTQFIYNDGTNVTAVSSTVDPVMGGDLSGTVSNAQIVADAVGPTEIAADAVTTVKILNSNVTAGKIASDAVTTVKILNSNVTAGKIASDAVTTVKILNSNVTDAKIATMASSKLTGALPAIDGSALTALNASNLGSGTAPTVRLGSGTADATTFLRGDNSWAAAGGGKVIQVVSTIETAAVSGSAAQGGTTAAMISLAITPTLSSSKILVLYSVTCGPSYDNFATQTSVFRAGTQILQAAAAGSRQRVTTSNVNGNNNKNLLSNSYTGLDSPATTSAITYDIRLSSSNDGGTATLYLNRSSVDSDIDRVARGSSSITLMEIGV